jgi:iron complex outermembrane receptor protein
MKVLSQKSITVNLSRALILAFSLVMALGAQETNTLPSAGVSVAPAQDLTAASLEQLMGLNVVVTSASKKAESLRNATSAIYVITQEDIRRSGAQTLPDLLAMVPGVQVARQSANEWAISARGFNGQYNNKMLVLIDGRSVYDPVMGGVNWNQQDAMLEDVDHIEVIRGPGGTLWGSNAVNGVVNIITKDSKVTQGLYLGIGAGSPLYPAGVSGTTSLNGTGAIRYGGKLSEDLYYRVYGQVNNANNFANPEETYYDETGLGTAWNDAWYDYRAGFRGDWDSEQDQMTLEAEAQSGHFNYARLTNNVTSVFDPSSFSQGNDLNADIDRNAHFLGRWTRDFKDDSQIQALAYYDYNNLTTANDSRITNVGQADLELQHRFHLGSVNEITWGGSYRNISDQFFNPINFAYSPENQNLNIYAGFLQDKLTIEEARLYLTGGVKLENNPYTGNEWQPSGRLLWTPDDTNSVWGAVSRSVRIPTQYAETDFAYLYGLPANAFGPGAPPSSTYEGVIPNPSLVSETLVSYELGYRTNPTKDTSADIATFYNHYDNLVSFRNYYGAAVNTPNGGVMDPSYLQVFQQQNTGVGNIWGVEVAGQWNPASTLKVNFSYTYQGYDQNMVNASNTELGAPPPHNLANARVYFDPFLGIELNTSFYYTDATFMYDPISGNTIIPDYVQWNLGASYKPTENLEISLWGLDLEGAHVETLPSAFISPAEVVPAVCGKVAWRY